MALGYQDEVYTTDVAKRRRKRNLDRFGQTTTEEGGIKRGSKKKKIVPRDRSKTSRKGVGTLEGKKPQRKDMTGVNQTPITLGDVGKSTAKGAAAGASLALNPFGKAGLLAKFKAKLAAYNKARKARIASRTNPQKLIAQQKKLEGKRLLTKAEKRLGKKYLDPANPDMRMADIGFKKGGAVKKTRSTTKKKSIDGIAMRGKTKVKRVKG